MFIKLKHKWFCPGGYRMGPWVVEISEEIFDQWSVGREQVLPSTATIVDSLDPEIEPEDPAEEAARRIEAAAELAGAESLEAQLEIAEEVSKPRGRVKRN